MTQTDSKRYRIGEVRALLTDEFPDVTISKLRFLQDKGIVQPERTPGGYRMYSNADVEALRIALRMQRDEFMPLRIIRDELQRRIAKGVAKATQSETKQIKDFSEIALRQNVQQRLPSNQPLNLNKAPALVSIEALTRGAGVDEGFVRECIEHDLISGRADSDGNLRFSQEEVALVTSAKVLQQLGLDLRHLRQTAMNAARQGSVVEQYSAPLLRSTRINQQDQVLSTIEALTVQLAEFMKTAFIRDVKMMVENTISEPYKHATPLL